MKKAKRFLLMSLFLIVGLCFSAGLLIAMDTDLFGLLGGYNKYQNQTVDGYTVSIYEEIEHLSVTGEEYMSISFYGPDKKLAYNFQGYTANTYEPVDYISVYDADGNQRIYTHEDFVSKKEKDGYAYRGYDVDKLEQGGFFDSLKYRQRVDYGKNLDKAEVQRLLALYQRAITEIYGNPKFLVDSYPRHY